MPYYGSKEPLAEVPFNFQLLSVKSNMSGREVKELAEDWLNEMKVAPAGSWPNWLLGNHDSSRVASRVNPKLVDGLNMLITLVGGTTITYYGEEIGMTDTFLTFEETQDPAGKSRGKEGYMEHSRDPERSPMQWDNTSNAGFSDGPTPWLPVNSNYPTVNVENQKSLTRSHLGVYKQLLNLRQKPAILFGRRDFAEGLHDDLLGFARVKKGTPGYVVLINFGASEHNIDVITAFEGHGYSMSDQGTVELCGSHVPPNTGLKCEVAKTKVNLPKVGLGPYEAVVLNFVPSFS
jgi:alpha-glucosidase